jgi:ABC-type sugar transport system ATPase subunit
MKNILEFQNISMEFPGVKALDDVSFEIYDNEIHAIVGENGAGKSTLMKIISGVYQATSGQILFKGEPLVVPSPKAAQEQGISIIHQEFSLIPDLDAVENIFLGNEIVTSAKFLDRKAMEKEAKARLSRLGVDIDISTPVRNLSVANQQFVEIAKALLEGTSLIIFDEPTAALTSSEASRLFELIYKLKSEGMTILYISHHLEEIFEISDRYSVLRDGQYVGTCISKESDEDEMIRLMVGRDIENQFPEPKKNIDGEVVIKVNKLSNEFVHDVSFEVRKGEILGLAGLVGAGRTEIIRALFGADPVDVSDIEIDGKKVSIKSPADAIKNGIGLIPENRKSEGLIIDQSVKNNTTITLIDKLVSSLKFINKSEERKLVDKSISDLRIKTPSMDTLIKNLSGGNQQKVVLAKWLNLDLKVLIFDEPTRGIDVGAKEEIYKLIRRLTDHGLAVIIVSSELNEVLGLSDRVLSIYDGTIAAEFDREDATQERVMYYCTGGKDGEKKSK